MEARVVASIGTAGRAVTRTQTRPRAGATARCARVASPRTRAGHAATLKFPAILDLHNNILQESIIMYESLLDKRLKLKEYLHEINTSFSLVNILYNKI